MQLLLAQDWKPGILALRHALIDALAAGRRVLWFVPGGSNIQAAVMVMSAIPENLSRQLTITLSDERFGPAGHPDSNWQQLTAAGFNFKLADQLPVLSAQTEELETARSRFETNLESAMAGNDFLIAQLGIGPDGHIAGILPGSPAVTTNSLVAAYETPTYTRLTTTFKTLRQLNAAYVFAFGAEKAEALQNLEQDLPLNVQPAQIIKDIAEAYVFNDQRGKEV